MVSLSVIDVRMVLFAYLHLQLRAMKLLSSEGLCCSWRISLEIESRGVSEESFFPGRVALLNLMEGKKDSSQSIIVMEAHAPASLWAVSQCGAVDLEAGKATVYVQPGGAR